MAIYKRESLDHLRDRIDLVEVLSPYVQLKRSGTTYKGLCPFHDEKSPSFMVHKGDKHYHCFGCGAHGDAIAFLMGHASMSFADAIENLAERFGVVLEREDAQIEPTGPSRTLLKEALQKAADFFHFCLLYSNEGQEALKYLYSRGLDLHFIRTFQIGYAPGQRGIFQGAMKLFNITDAALEGSGLISSLENNRKRDFFSERIMFPIRDSVGSVIGFSGRKIKEEVFGGKYINTSETSLFKKSKVLFGLSYSRRRIAKERKAIIVEGQIDALRLIHAGFDFTVAGQGTAFGEGHVRELLNLGANHVYLALDGDTAGLEAAAKIGDLFQRKGVGVSVVCIPKGSDPDSLLREQGPGGFTTLLDKSIGYLPFLIAHLSKTLNVQTPSGKNELIQTLSKRIKEWEQPVMIYESLLEASKLLGVPQEVMQLENVQPLILKKSEHINFKDFDPDQILETDFLRWLILEEGSKRDFLIIAKLNLTFEHFRKVGCRRIYEAFIKADHLMLPKDLLSLGSLMETELDQQILTEIMQKKVNLQKSEEGFYEVIKRILQRQWMEEREAIKVKIQSGNLSEEEVLECVKVFDVLKKTPPQIILPSR